MPASPQRKPSLLTILLLIAGLAAIFFVPYLFPHPDGHSQSYMAHYSNRVAQLLVFATMFVLGWFTDVFGLRYPPATSRQDRSPIPRWPLAFLATFSAAFAALLWLVERRTGPAGEALYFLDRYAAHDLGARLYRDMEFSYGPLLFWPQLAVSRLLHLSRGDAHFLLFTLQWPAGFALLWYFCRRLAQTPRIAVSLFLLLGYGWINLEITGGLNYTPLRFLAAPALVLRIDQLLRAGASATRLLAWSLLGFALLLFFSPEQGIAFAFATVVYLGLCQPDHRLRLPLAAFAAGCAALLAVAYRTGVLDTLLSIGGGLLDFPLLPSTRSLILLTAVLLAGALAFAAARRRQLATPELYLTLLSFAFLPAALGRSDPGHVFINLLPLLSIAFCSLSTTRTGFRLASAGLLLFSLLITKKAIVPSLQATAARYRQRSLPTSAVIDYPRLLAPLGYPREFARPTPRPIYVGRYPTYLELMNPREPAIKIAELASQPGVPLLLPVDSIPSACLVTDARRRSDLNSPVRPWFLPPLRALDTSAPVLCDYIAAHYRKTTLPAPTPGYDVWSPLPGSHLN